MGDIYYFNSPFSQIYLLLTNFSTFFLVSKFNFISDSYVKYSYSLQYGNNLSERKPFKFLNIDMLCLFLLNEDFEPLVISCKLLAKGILSILNR